MSEAMSAIATAESARESKQIRIIVWVVSLTFAGLMFDGYDLVIHGACVSTFPRDAARPGAATPAIAGQPGSYEMFGGVRPMEATRSGLVAAA